LHFEPPDKSWGEINNNSINNSIVVVSCTTTMNEGKIDKCL
jgi:hypothetical protein